MKTRIRKFNKRAAATFCALSMCGLATVSAQSELYPQHFDISEVHLTESPLLKAMYRNDSVLLDYDADRLVTPFIRQAGLADDASSKYYKWTTSHPSFENWGLSSWSLEGHAGGHYLTSLSLAYAACDNASLKSKLKERLDYCVKILKDCQDAYADNTAGLKGFIGGQPFNQVWTGLYSGDLTSYKNYGGWVPFYCQHKVLAGLRDAWVYTGNKTAKTCFKGLADWAINVVSKLDDNQMQTVLGWEHGGMNEALADAYKLFGDTKYLDAAKKYSHTYEINGMQGTKSGYSRTFLNGQHANTQVPKFIGFERIHQLDTTGGDSKYHTAAINFWDDVAYNRTVCIGGNSVSEHFLAADRGSQYINNLDGPESCNSNNMLKLSESLFDETHDAQYADFYEKTMWNHILSTQDPQTGGYVYFTSLRPQSYRIYSTVNESMWCCVGTGMENHGKYGHFVYTHSGSDTLFVNLFTPSKLDNGTFALTQETAFPYSQKTTLTIEKAGTYSLAVRHPAWTTDGYSVSVNGEPQAISAVEGTASYAVLSRKWKKGDVVEVALPMELVYEECPNYTDYIAFRYGPVLLAAKTTAESEAEAARSGLTYEALQNEYGHDGRMDHAPGSMATKKSLSSAPKLIGERADVLSRIKPLNTDSLTFSIDCDGRTLELQPFYSIHHARYACYWYQQTAENYAESDMGKQDARDQELVARTVDFVAPGEQQSEAGHDASYSSGSSSGNYNGETYRDAQANGFIQYYLSNPEQETENMSVALRFTVADKKRAATLYVNDIKIKDITIPESHKNADDNGFFTVEYALPTSALTDADGNVLKAVKVRIVASSTTLCPGLYGLRLLRNYQSNAYVFNAKDWITGDSQRVGQSNITYDEDKNTIRVNAGTGENNVCLGLDYANTDYTLDSSLKYFVARGKNLKTTAGSAYLWWLNGVNHGTSVAPTKVTKSTVNGETVFVWDMTKSGLDSNNTGDEYSICQGLTIFGLTSTTGVSNISYIGFSSTPDDTMTGISAVRYDGTDTLADGTVRYYDLAGRRVDSPESGIYIAKSKNSKNSKIYIRN